jgi:hypothetical protein
MAPTSALPPTSTADWASIAPGALLLHPDLQDALSHPVSILANQTKDTFEHGFSQSQLTVALHSHQPHMRRTTTMVMATARAGSRLPLLPRRFFSVRRAAELETQVVDHMRSIPDGLGLGDIVALGRVKVGYHDGHEPTFQYCRQS